LHDKAKKIKSWSNYLEGAFLNDFSLMVPSPQIEGWGLSRQFILNSILILNCVADSRMQIKV